MTADVASTAPQTPSGRLPTWALVVMLVSLAANLLVIGSVGAAMWRFGHGPHGPPHGWGPPNLLGYAMSLGPERHRELLDSTSALREALRPMRKDLRDARNAVTDAVGAEPFDLAKFEAAQQRLIEKESEARMATRAIYSAIVSRLTLKERQAYAEWREHRRSPSILDDVDAPEPPDRRGGPRR